jgi:YVTN family beta-propeller protein
MDVSADGVLLLVANNDNGSVTVVDTKERKARREIKVGEKPEGVCWIGNGPLAAVTVYREDAVVFFDAATGQIVKKLAVGNESYGIIANRAGTRLWVTNDYPGTITEIDPKEMKVVASYPVGSFIRGICLSPDESRLFVTEFYTSILHAVDPNTGKVLDSWRGHSTDNLCRHVVLHPRRPKAYLSHLRARIEVIDGSGSIFPQVSICDVISGRDPAAGRGRKSFAMDTFNQLQVPTNPWEAALSPDGKLAYFIYAGTNDMNLCRIIDDDYREMEPIGSLIRIGQLPKAIRLSPDGKEVFIYNTMDFEVGIYNGVNMQKLGAVKVCTPPKTPEWVRGKILFSTALPPLTSRRWIACSSCHPDGLTDGRVWHNPEGLRKTPSLFGLAHTHPLHWSADRDEVQDFEYTIRGRLMQGKGLLAGPLKPKLGFKAIELEENTSGRSKDLDALAIYTNSFEATFLSPHITAAGKLSEAAQRGQKLFQSKEVGCSSCHNGPYYTDSSLQKPFKVHDVGTGNDDPSEKMGPKYDTPSLLYVYRTAPYLHHGKAPTLRDVLTTANKNDKHGKTSHLHVNEIDDLVAFLKSLPFELPPLETPNTVKYRVIPKRE